jgi:DNA-binding transcriptional ArsR family regulator
MKINQAVAALAALAQESRLAVFRLLVRKGLDGISAGDIAAAVDVPPATLSFHLKELAGARLIVSRRQGRSIIYSIDARGISSLMAFLTEDCCQGQPELCMPGNCCERVERSEKPRRKRTPA